jgi:hypothetical protein
VPSAAVDPKSKERNALKWIYCSLIAAAVVTGVVGQSILASEDSDGVAAPIYGVTIPPGYRDFKLIALNDLHIPGKGDQLRAQLGNDLAINAIREGKLPYPDGSIIVALHWTRVPSEDNNRVLAGPFPGDQSFVVGSRVNMQVMVKDSKKYASSGGWGFADFTDGMPGDKALHETCFACHLPAKDRDYVFARYAP